MCVCVCVCLSQASLVTVQEKNNQMLDHYDNAEIKSDVDRCKAHVKDTLQMDRDFTPEVSPPVCLSVCLPMWYYLTP